MYPRHLFASFLLLLHTATGLPQAAAQPSPSIAPVIAEVDRRPLPQQALSVGLISLDGLGIPSFHNADGIVNLQKDNSKRKG